MHPKKGATWGDVSKNFHLSAPLPKFPDPPDALTPPDLRWDQSHGVLLNPLWTGSCSSRRHSLPQLFARKSDHFGSLKNRLKKWPPKMKGIILKNTIHFQVCWLLVFREGNLQNLLIMTSWSIEGSLSWKINADSRPCWLLGKRNHVP